MASRYQKHVKWATKRALIEIGKDIRYRLRQVVGVPVEVDSSGYIWRSDPGEPPRKEPESLRTKLGRDGESLQESIDYRVEDDPEGLEDLVVFTTAKHASWLELGTKWMEPRPWFFSTIRAMGDLKRKFKTLFAKYMQQSYEESEDAAEDDTDDLSLSDNEFDPVFDYYDSDLDLEI